MDACNGVCATPETLYKISYKTRGSAPFADCVSSGASYYIQRSIHRCAARHGQACFQSSSGKRCPNVQIEIHHPLLKRPNGNGQIDIVLQTYLGSERLIRWLPARENSR